MAARELPWSSYSFYLRLMFKGRRVRAAAFPQDGSARLDADVVDAMITTCREGPPTVEALCQIIEAYQLIREAELTRT